MSHGLALHRDLEAFVRRDDTGRGRLELLVRGARCAGCISKIEKAVRALPGVDAARLNLTTGKLAVELTDKTADPGQVLETVEDLGYRACLFDPAEADAAQDREGKELAVALGVAGFGAGNVMMFTVPAWAGLFGQELTPATLTVMYWMAAIVATPCALFAGRPFFRSAWASLKRGKANMDVPISIGVILTLIVSFSETLLGGKHAYFDAAVTLLFLLLIGRYLDHRLRAGARSAARDLLALQTPVAMRLVDGAEQGVPVAEIRVGDLLAVAPGERIPVDGLVEEGASEIDNALITGETALVPVASGARLHAGALNLSGRLVMKATARTEDSTLAAIARLMEAGAQARSTYVRLADKAAALYVPVVHTAAALTFVGCWALGLGPREALLRAAAVLIVTCPCALGLAVPAVQIAASSRLFRKGVLVKSGAALERLAEIDHVVFDKTGVLTEGRPALIDAPAHLVATAAPLARASRHPLARALAAEAGAGPVAQDCVETAGQGVEGVIDGRRARLGRASFVGVKEPGVRETELWFGFEGDVKIRFAFEDLPRSDARDTIAKLSALGLSVEILSGDVEGPVRDIASDIGVTAWRAGLTPVEKAAIVDDLKARGRKVLMVGDGLNDAAALAKAHASMAPGAAVDAAQNAADLVFTGEGLGAVIESIETARDARRRALENFAFSALYNVVATPAAMFGLVNPFVAALAMSGSSIVVLLNAARPSVGRFRR
ncbi:MULTISPECIES: heavy metal translocating P-type ATPase [unclassified Caulobacter]|uniref:heavy metal translocating P-type ATPase n=1 Tax=unclassified Caulobacter TaxID=2648921 RepID=UPI0007823806|nr:MULTISPECIES: heavy metal translocating P-type ATPase [unclassified Caulobacter]AZS21540.1 cadmium-translocating P-type ATPase [Caulobacter sp. FWC26]